MNRLCAVGIFLLAGSLWAARPQISDDRDLKEIDLTQWDCLNQLEGSAKTPDGVERNHLKNRSAPAGALPTTESTDSAGFLKRIFEFETQTKGLRRKDLNPAQKEQLDHLEKQIVAMTGYLGLAYCGPPETTNCGSGDFHDWHLEVFENPPEHPPQPGDPTPIICEITPRTQNAIYRDGIRIHELAAFFRRADLAYEPTGHKAQKIRVTGYLMWDDEHNGAADVGTAIRSIGANKYHNPWRSIAWEIHPVFKIERADGAAAAVSTPVSEPTASPSPAPPVSPPPSTTSTPEPLAPLASSTPPQLVTVLKPVRIKIAYGEATLSPGTQLRIILRAGQTVTVDYMGASQVIPISSTDLH
jgi:hypothetical protein